MPPAPQPDVVEAPAAEAPAPAEPVVEAQAPSVEEATTPVEDKPRRKAAEPDPEQALRTQALDAERVRQDEFARQLAAQQVGGRLIVKAQAPAGAEEAPATTAEAAVPGAPAAPVEEEDEDEAKAKRGRQKKTPAVSPKPTERRRGKLTINQAIDEGEGIQSVRSVAAFRRAR
jgi:translation initiation factor IF-2